MPSTRCVHKPKRHIQIVDAWCKFFRNVAVANASFFLPDVEPKKNTVAILFTAKAKWDQSAKVLHLKSTQNS